MTGSLANVYAYAALLRPGDTILRLDLSHGGHLSHGHRGPSSSISEASYRYNTEPYHLNEATGRIDYAELSILSQKLQPRIITIGGSVYCRHLDFSRLRRIADEAKAMVHYDMSHVCGQTAAGIFPSPFRYCDVVTSTAYKTLRGPQGAFIFFKRDMEESIDATVFPRFQCGTSYRNIAGLAAILRQAQSAEFLQEQKLFVNSAKVVAEGLLERGYRLLSGGTDTHMMLLDLKQIGITGWEAEHVLSHVNIIANQNAVPGDHGLNFSGIRIATPIMCIRGMEAEGFIHLTELIHKALQVAKSLKANFDSETVSRRMTSKISRRSDREKFADFVVRASQHRGITTLKEEITSIAREYPVPEYLVR